MSRFRGHVGHPVPASPFASPARRRASSRLAHATVFAVLLLAWGTSACVLAPRGLDEERDRLHDAGPSFEEPVESRTLPPLSARPTCRELLQRAFLTNGEIEAAWQEWRAALARVTREATWPAPGVELGLEHMFSDENMTAWDRTTVMAGFDAMEALDWPSTTKTRGRAALEEARAAGERFRARKFALQRRFLETWIECTSLREDIRLSLESLSLLRLASDAAARAAASGGDEREILRARAEVARAEDELARMRAMEARAVVELGMLVGGTEPVSVDPPPGPPARRTLAATDAQLYEVAARENPMLAEWTREVAGRADMLEVARAAWLPDLKPSAGFTGGVSQFVGLSITLPTAVPAIRAAIEEARADLARAEALSRQARTDARATLTSELIALREAERASAYLETTLLPLLTRMSASTRNAYAGGRVRQRDWLEALQMELEARRAALAAAAAREISLARIEETLGVDLETVVERTEVAGG